MPYTNTPSLDSMLKGIVVYGTRQKSQEVCSRDKLEQQADQWSLPLILYEWPFSCNEEIVVTNMQE